MTIIEKKIQALKALETLDKKLNDGLNVIATACKQFKDENPLNGTKSENAIIKQYHKKVDKILATLPETPDEATDETPDEATDETPDEATDETPDEATANVKKGGNK